MKKFNEDIEEIEILKTVSLVYKELQKMLEKYDDKVDRLFYSGLTISMLVAVFIKGLSIENEERIYVLRHIENMVGELLAITSKNK